MSPGALIISELLFKRRKRNRTDMVCAGSWIAPHDYLGETARVREPGEFATIGIFEVDTHPNKKL